MHGPLRKRRGRKRRLVRRLREAVKLFACPVRRHPAMATAEQKLHVSEFTNEPFVDFSKAENRRAMEEALKKVAGEFSREYPMYIGGKRVTTSEKRASTNPSHPSQAIGIFQVATVEIAKQAVEAAHKAFDSWKRVPTERRTDCLFQAPKILRERIIDITALVGSRVGRTG